MKTLFNLALVACLALGGYKLYINENEKEEEVRVAKVKEQKADKFSYYKRVLKILPTVGPFKVKISSDLNDEVWKVKGSLKKALAKKKVLSEDESARCEDLLARIKSYLAVNRGKSSSCMERHLRYKDWYRTRHRS